MGGELAAQPLFVWKRTRTHLIFRVYAVQLGLFARDAHQLLVLRRGAAADERFARPKQERGHHEVAVDAEALCGVHDVRHDPKSLAAGVKRMS